MGDSVVGVIVDCYSTGLFFPEKLKLRGIETVVVFSSPHLLGKFTHALTGHQILDSFVYSGDEKALLSWLSRYLVILALPGFERGVILAERIATLLNLPNHDPSLTLARRDKFLMLEALKARGVYTMDYFCSSSVTGLLSWADSTNNWPYIVKPLHSAGTEMVRVCSFPEEVSDSASAIIGSRDQFGILNTDALIQERLAGTEYILDTITLDGKHYVTDLWVYHKILIDGVPIYDYFLLIPFADSLHEMVPYLFSALDALGFQNGPSHSEIMMTSDGPVLIETGARIIGGKIPPDLMDRCLGYNPVDLALDCILDPDRVHQKLSQPYGVREYLLVKVLISDRAGIIKAIPNIDKIRALPSYAGENLPDIGSSIFQTINHPTSPGKIFLAHADLQVLMDDYETIRILESSGLFEI